MYHACHEPGLLFRIAGTTAESTRQPSVSHGGHDTGAAFHEANQCAINIAISIRQEQTDPFNVVSPSCCHVVFWAAGTLFEASPAPGMFQSVRGSS